MSEKCFVSFVNKLLSAGNYSTLKLAQTKRLNRMHKKQKIAVS